MRLAEMLHEMGVDLIDCSSGGNIASAKIPLGPGYQVSFSEAVRATGILTSAVGMITRWEQINSILENEKADMVLLGRELLRNPYFPLAISGENEQPVLWPEQYLRAR